MPANLFLSPVDLEYFFFADESNYINLYANIFGSSSSFERSKSASCNLRNPGVFVLVALSEYILRAVTPFLSFIPAYSNKESRNQTR